MTQRRDIFGQPVFAIGDRVREKDGRHVGTVRAVLWSRTARVVWDHTGYVSDLQMAELEGHDDADQEWA
jgi:hypothetical protein